MYNFNLDINISELKLQVEEVQDAKWVTLEQFEIMSKNQEIVPSVIECFNIIKNKIF